MDAVVLAAGEGTRLRPQTETRPKGLVEVAGKPLLTHCFDALHGLGIDELVVVVGYRKSDIVDRYGDAYGDVPITYVHQREQRGLAHALLRAEPHVDDDFALMLGDNVFRADLTAAVDRHRDTGADATLLVEEVSEAEAGTTGVVETAPDGEVVSLVEKPDDPPSTLVQTGFFVFSPAVFHACHLVRPSDRGEYELTDAIDLLLRSGRRVETVELDGWRVNVNAEADIEDAERRIRADS
ncbi:sugar nucleotidyltransferase [Halostella sp. JP-L12]|uniref:UTP--glucose-1-phosphate uridylyltransferase AglF n=1 Tax=Halostella TaxID=1843185 RepID=UPI000EF80759|nr:MULTISPECIES: UTP--glucose-1-phosphate uridylyltransferase AglF [Halostella]NHN48694.1 sugar nucleotidyltransferase [Halostella sp. JP-L12]